MDHKDSKFDFSPSELELVCDKSFFIQKALVLTKIKDHYSKLEEVIHKIDLPCLPSETKKRGKISQGENYLGAPWVVLDTPAYFSGAEIFAFRHIFLWGLNISTTFHVSGKFLERVDFDAIFNLMNPEMMVLKGQKPFIHHYDPLLYKPIRELSMEEIKSMNHLRISVFSKPDEWAINHEKSVQFITDIQTILKKE
ncbi:MAG: hypothetical protein RL491_270 [Bacteroidota bacterium]|jgi:hypothetical protein